MKFIQLHRKGNAYWINVEHIICFADQAICLIDVPKDQYVDETAEEISTKIRQALFA